MIPRLTSSRSKTDLSCEQALVEAISNSKDDPGDYLTGVIGRTLDLLVGSGALSPDSVAKILADPKITTKKK